MCLLSNFLKQTSKFVSRLLVKRILLVTKVGIATLVLVYFVECTDIDFDFLCKIAIFICPGKKNCNLDLASIRMSNANAECNVVRFIMMPGSFGRSKMVRT